LTIEQKLILFIKNNYDPNPLAYTIGYGNGTNLLLEHLIEMYNVLEKISEFKQTHDNTETSTTEAIIAKQAIEEFEKKISKIHE